MSTHHRAAFVGVAILAISILSDAQTVQRANRSAAKLGAAEKQHLLETTKKLYGSSAPNDVSFVGVKDLDPGTRMLRQNFEGSASSVHQTSEKGDTAAGVVIAEESGDLYLDVKPCDGKVISFHQPYHKSTIGEVVCDRKTFPKVQVTQR